MKRIFSTTNGIHDWKAKLADPKKHWKREYSAFETAVSWECAAIIRKSGLPIEIESTLASVYSNPVLMFAIPEHKVALPGGPAASQSDVWAVISTDEGLSSLTVEAKVKEAFGDKILSDWLKGKTDKSINNRKERWKFIYEHLPESDYSEVRYQLLQRCAAAVIEAKMFRIKHAAFIVQAFQSPNSRFNEFEMFCNALGVVDPIEKGKLFQTEVEDIKLSVGWVDCKFATDEEILELSQK